MSEETKKAIEEIAKAVDGNKLKQAYAEGVADGLSAATRYSGGKEETNNA